MRSTYDADGNLVRRVFPAGNEVQVTYASAPRAARRNAVEVRLVAGPRGGGADRVTRFTYEPLFQQVASVTDPRGTTPGFVPPLGVASAARYTARFFHDYQEGADLIDEAEEYGIDVSSVARGLGDLNGDGRTDQVQGNVVRSVAPSVLLRADSFEAVRLGSTTQAIVTETWWNDRGQPLAAIDAEGNVSEWSYFPAHDPDGDGVAVVSPLGPLSTEPAGYLRAVVGDARTSPRRTATTPPLALEATVSYDAVGNVVRARNARGVVTELEVNALNEVVSVVRGADVGVARVSGQLHLPDPALRYLSRRHFDHNGRVVHTEVESRDSTPTGVGDFVERWTVYDLLGNVVERRAEVDATTTLVTRLRYDLNANLTLIERPGGDRTQLTYDERDLLLRVTRGFGAPEESTVELDYDANGNRARVLDAEDSDGDGAREAVTFTYDGFDRLVAITDALGNQALTTYDPASNVVQRAVQGHPPAQPTAPAVLLSDVRLLHDELGRVFRVDAPLWVAAGFSPARPVSLLDHDGDGLVSSFAEFDALSRPVATVEDDLEATRTTWDGAGRPIETADAVGNRRTVEYDRGSNPVRVTSVEVSPEGPVPAEGFTTFYVWDQVDRLARVTDSAGQTATFSFDGRDRVVLRADAVGPLVADPLGVVPGVINAPGNTTTYVFDGLDRLLAEVHDLRVGGQGGNPLDTTNPANPDGQVTVRYTWDSNSRLAAIVDDKGQTTSFGWDALDRKVRHTYADGESYQHTFDRDSNPRTTTDPNGSVIGRTFDALNRLVRVDVARGPGVVGTTRETFSYDGLSRLVAATDDNGAAGAPHTVERVYDSLSRLVEERQDGRAVSSTYTGDGKRAQVTYPGGRVIARTFDAIDRIVTLEDADGGVLARSSWIGGGYRELQRTLGNGTRLSFLDDLGRTDVGYDAVQRVVRLRHLLPGGQAFVDREYGHDRASNRTFERRHDDQGLTDHFRYDSLYRVIESRYDEDGPASAARRDVLAARYQLDGVGNRVEVVRDRLGSGSVLQATERVDLEHASVVTGHVVADGAGSGPSVVDLGPEARVQGDATGRLVSLGNRARVDGQVHADRVTAHNSASAGGVDPFVAPSALVPSVEPVQPGTLDVTVRPGQFATIPAGRYRRVQVGQGADVTLLGGSYELDQLTVGPDATLRVERPVLVRARGLHLERGARVVPGFGVRPEQLRFELAGGDARLGPEVAFVGVLVAPAGQVDLAARATLQGQALARRVRLGPSATATNPGATGGERVETTEAYTVNAVNEYTSVGGGARTNDDNGNLTDDGGKLFFYDYKNRLVGVSERATGNPVASYEYLADGRRAKKVVYSQTTPGQVQKATAFFYDGAQEVEEQDAGSGATEATYVWSPVYVDELVTYTNAAGTFYTHQDARCDVVAITDAAGNVVERVRFDDFGRAEIRGPGGEVRAASAVGCAYGFQGRRLDAETGLLYFRARMYDPATGRFLQRDPVWDAGNVGGQYTFCGNGPASRRDPSGLSDEFLTAAWNAFKRTGHLDDLSALANRLQRSGRNPAVELIEYYRGQAAAPGAPPVAPGATAQRLAQEARDLDNARRGGGAPSKFGEKLSKLTGELDNLMKSRAGSTPGPLNATENRMLNRIEGKIVSLLSSHPGSPLSRLPRQTGGGGPGVGTVIGIAISFLLLTNDIADAAETGEASFEVTAGEVLGTNLAEQIAADAKSMAMPFPGQQTALELLLAPLPTPAELMELLNPSEKKSCPPHRD